MYKNVKHYHFQAKMFCKTVDCFLHGLFSLFQLQYILSKKSFTTLTTRSTSILSMGSTCIILQGSQILTDSKEANLDTSVVVKYGPNLFRVMSHDAIGEKRHNIGAKITHSDWLYLTSHVTDNKQSQCFRCFGVHYCFTLKYFMIFVVFYPTFAAPCCIISIICHLHELFTCTFQSILSLFCSLFDLSWFVFKPYLHDKNVDLRGIRTRIVGVVGERDDRLPPPKPWEVG